jgi:hypothetical protein
MNSASAMHEVMRAILVIQNLLLGHTQSGRLKHLGKQVLIDPPGGHELPWPIPQSPQRGMTCLPLNLRVEAPVEDVTAFMIFPFPKWKMLQKPALSLIGK